jgi:DNA replication protein DnaC
MNSIFYKKYLKYKKKYLQKLTQNNNNLIQKGGLNRLEILRLYKNNVSSFIENKEENLALLLQSYNKPYSPVTTGMWYAEDYSRLINRDDDTKSIKGLSNKHYWDIGVSRANGISLLSYFQSFDYIKPSDALKSFIIGPTFLECANAIQVAIYHHILNIVGEQKFNYLFGNLLTPFIITPHIFEPIQLSERKKTFDKSYEAITGNPLYFLYDKIYDYSLSSLENNDIIYIDGVSSYQEKHFSGIFPGFNLICYRPSKLDEPRFVGFGPNEFATGPLTYEEIRQILVDGYNQDQDENTKKFIQIRLQNPLLKSSGELAQIMENHKVSRDYKIVGITHRLRFNQDKLKRFIETPRQEWYNESIDKLQELLPKVSPKSVDINILSKSFSNESKDATFDNFVRSTQLQEDMCNYMLKFSIKVLSQTKGTGPLGIILSGSAGTGKTHLSVAVAKYVAHNGKKVTFVDADYIGSLVTSSGLPNLETHYSGSDLIILDDINSETGAESIFLKQVLNFVILNNKALLFSSNNKMPIIQANLPKFFGYDSPFVKNFFYINNIVADSNRKPWTDINLNTISNDDKYILLNDYTGKQSAGIIIETPDVDEYIYIEQFRRRTGNTEPIRIVRNWEEEQSLLAFGTYGRTRELQSYHRHHKGDVTDLEQYKIIIIRIYNLSRDQLLNILPRLHDNGIKIIILVESLVELKKLIIKELDTSFYEPNKIKLINRLNIIFPNLYLV